MAELVAVNTSEAPGGAARAAVSKKRYSRIRSETRVNDHRLVACVRPGQK